jgi:hypothetical protein
MVASQQSRQTNEAAQPYLMECGGLAAAFTIETDRSILPASADSARIISAKC